MCVGACSITNHRLGPIIDMFDEVVRFNNFSFVPEFTGTKTTAVFRNNIVPHLNYVSESTTQICSMCHESKSVGWGYWQRYLAGMLHPEDYCLPHWVIQQANMHLGLPADGIVVR